MDLDSEKLGTMLIEEGVITEEQLSKATEFKESVGGKLGDVLVKLDFVTEEELTEVVAREQNMDTIDLENMILPEDLIRELPREIIERHEVIPVEQNEGTLKLAVHDPSDFEAIEEVQLVTDYRVEPALAPRESILKAINEMFYQEGRAGEETGVLDDETGEETMEMGMAEGELSLEEIDPGVLLKALTKTLLDLEVISVSQLESTISQLREE